ncbi:MAG: amidohydrolase [Desulfobacterales bacterium]|nr:amidohydrolase [Desulfobacterales bacterium]
MGHRETLYHGGRIHTADTKRPEANAVAVRDGIIVAVGSEQQCRSSLSQDFDSVDLTGAVLLPGFIDTHLHPPAMIIYELGADLTGVASMEDLRRRIREMAEKDPSSNWVMGLQFEDQSLVPPRLPDRHDLDKACANRPVVLMKRDGHTVMANSEAIRAAGVSGATPDPSGGRIDREPDGSPSGVFRETAAQILIDAMPFPDIQTIVDAAASVFARLAANGITSVGMILQTDEEGISGSKGVFDVPLMELVSDAIPISLYTILAGADINKIKAAQHSVLHRSEPGRGRRVNGYKLWADGTFASSTAYLRLPFSDGPDKTGFLIHKPEEMYRRMVDAHNAGLQIAIHSIGDAGTQVCIELYDRLLREFPRPNHRHRLEHASLLDDRLIADIVRLDLVVSTQPIFIHSEKGWLHQRLGPDRAKWVYPFRSMLDAGVRLAGASDAPVESLNVLHAIQCCVTREGFEPQQAITADEAIGMFTINAAYAQFEENVTGSITPGKRADLVILDNHPASVPPESIKDIQVQQTICAGRVIYDAFSTKS